MRASLPAAIEIRKIIPPEAERSQVMADPTEIHQILMNLCANAGHAMRHRGGILEMSLENVDLELSTLSAYSDAAPGRYLKLSVKDTGRSMTPEVKQRIIDPYFTTKDPGEGTDLGLSIVYSIVQSYHGHIDLYSEPTEGSSFHVMLPRLEGDVVPVDGQRVNSPSAGTGRIMIVDDEQIVLGMLQQMLDWLGYEVTVRCSSLEALEVFRCRPEAFDLVHDGASSEPVAVGARGRAHPTTSPGEQP